MMIYTGNAEGAKLDKVEELGMGIMIASSATWKPKKDYRRVPCALDNGAFQCYRRGFPFMEDVFLDTIATAYKVGLSLDFIVCPDIVAGGWDSLVFSLSWANNQLKTVPNLALALQDGIDVANLQPAMIKKYSHLFIGGSVEWKWEHAKEIVEFAHANGKKCHIGQCGTLDRLRYARDIGADSVDSTSIVRNDSWHIVEEYHSGGDQMELIAREDS